MLLNTTKILGQLTLVFLGMAASMSLTAAGDPEKGKVQFQICVACHGANAEGNKILNAPATAALTPTYLLRQLHNLKAGIRGTDPRDTYGAQMRPMTMVLINDQAMEDVAAYIATLPMPNPETTVDGDIEAGKKAFAPCLACHGEQGQGIPELKSPRLAQQHDWYLVRQLQNFKAGIRGSDTTDIFGTQMRHMAQLLLDDQAVNDVVAYIGTL